MTGIVRDNCGKRFDCAGRGKWVLTRPFRTFTLVYPRAATNAGNQFEQLSAEEQRILETCSVAGERFFRLGAAAMLETCNLDRRNMRQTSATAAVHQICGYSKLRWCGFSHYEFRTRYIRQALYAAFEREPVQLHRSLGEWLMAAYICGRGNWPRNSRCTQEGDFEQPALLLWTAETPQAICAWRSIAASTRARIGAIVPPDRIELEIELLQRMATHTSLLSDVDSALASRPRRRAPAKQDSERPRSTLVVCQSGWYSSPQATIFARGVECAEAMGSVLLAQTELVTACFPLLYDTGETRPGNLRFATHHPASQPEYTGKRVLV